MPARSKKLTILRKARAGAAAAQFKELQRLAIQGDMTLYCPTEGQWVLRRRAGNEAICQFWPSAELIQEQGTRTRKKPRPCTLDQFRAMLHNQLGCPPVLTEKSK